MPEHGWSRGAQSRNETLKIARKMEGSTFERVRYCDLDYRQMDHSDAPEEPRVIEDTAEWDDPNWRRPNFDAIDFYVEVQTDDRSHFAITWGVPGEDEGLIVREVVVATTLLHSRTPAALWDVTASPPWSRLVGKVIDSVEVGCRAAARTAENGCEVLTIRAGDELIMVFLGGVGENESMVPSVTNLLVISPPTALPQWVLG